VNKWLKVKFFLRKIFTQKTECGNNWINFPICPTSTFFSPSVCYHFFSNFKGCENMKNRRIPRDKMSASERFGGFFGDWQRRFAAMREHDPRRFLRGLAFGAAGFLLGGAELYFSASPLGTAWICAAPEGIPYIMTGVLLSALLRGEEALVFSLSAIFAVSLRVVVRCAIEPPKDESLAESLFSESVYLRMATSAVAAFAVGFYRIFVGGFYIYDLCGCIASTVIAPVATTLFMPQFDKNEDQLPEPDSTAGKLLSEASYFALLFSLTLAARGIEFAGLSPLHIAVTSAILYTVKNKGAARGIIAGALCGAVGGFEYCVTYAVGAAGAALFMNLSVLAAGVAIPICGALRSLFFSDAEGFILLFPSQVAGLALFCLISLFRERMYLFEHKAPSLAESAAVPTDSRDRMRQLSAAFSGLAESFAELASQRRRPTEGELRAACDSVCDRVCLKCQKRNLCWNLEYASTLDIISKICSSVSTHGFVEAADLPEYMRRRCPSIDEITDGVNRAATDLVRECLEDGRLAGFSADYRAVSAALAEAVAEDTRENSEDLERTERVGKILASAGVKYSSVSVIGKRRIVIRAENVNLSRASLKAAELRKELEKALDCMLSPPTLTPSGSGISLEFFSRRRFSVCSGAARSSAQQGDPCGDNICTVDNGDDYFYAVICDGMGQGSRAAFASGASIGFLKQMLEAKMSVETSLSVLNAWLRADREECSVSIDILKIDLLNGNGAIYKSGAAPSFLRRGRDVFPIEAEGFPIGILKQTNATRTDLVLSDGDVILMGSDGIDPDGRIVCGDEVWLLDILESVDAQRNESASLAAKRTVSAARLAGSSDDVCALYVTLRAEPFEEE
jgi:stage II sporulation protein E